MSSSQAPQVRTRIPRIAEVAVERARLTVVPRRRQRARRMPFLALVSMVLLSGVVGLLLFNTSMQQAAFTTTALEQQASTLSAHQQTLQMELEALRNPQRIATQARHLGMVQACTPAFLRLGSAKVVGQPCPGTGAEPLRIDPRGPVKPAILNPPTRVVTVPAAEAQAQAHAQVHAQAGAQVRPGRRSSPNSQRDTAVGNPHGGARQGRNVR